MGVDECTQTWVDEDTIDDAPLHKKQKDYSTMGAYLYVVGA